MLWLTLLSGMSRDKGNIDTVSYLHASRCTWLAELILTKLLQDQLEVTDCICMVYCTLSSWLFIVKMLTHIIVFTIFLVATDEYSHEVRSEPVNERTEGETVAPTTRHILYLHVLIAKTSVPAPDLESLQFPHSSHLHWAEQSKRNFQFTSHNTWSDNTN